MLLHDLRYTCLAKVLFNLKCTLSR